MPTVQAPITLGAFPSATDERTWIFPLGLVFDQAILNPEALNFDLWIDTFPTLGSPNAIKLTKTSADARLTSFQEGVGVGKAFQVRLPGRAFAAGVTWYWQARINTGAFLSPWSQLRSFTVAQRQDIVQAQALYAQLADENAYTKDANSANTYKLLLQVARELDLLQFEAQQSVGDLFLDGSRDAALANNFSTLLGLSAAATDTAANLRWRTKRLWKAFVDYPGTLQCLIDSVTAFVAEPPLVLDLTQTVGWILGQNFIALPSTNIPSPPIIIYSRQQRGNAFILTIFNSWNRTFDQKVLERFVRRAKPAHSMVTIQYSAVRHWSARYNLLADWQFWTTDANVDLATYPNAVAIAAGQTTTTLTSPPLNIPTVTAFAAPIINTTPSGQTVTVSYQTSPNGSAWSGYTQLQAGVTPGNAIPIQPWIQFQVVLSRTSAGAPTPILNLFEFVGTRS